MTRPRKQTVDYFPHTCKHGQTMFIIEQRYGNDGYAFWFKVLELLGSSEGHYLDLKKPCTINYLLAKTFVSKETAEEILNLLAELEAIDPELWIENKLIWSDNFLKGLSFAYRNREISIPNKPVIQRKITGICGTNDVRNPQSKVKESKGNKSKGNNKCLIPSNFGISDEVRKWAEGKYDALGEHLEAFIDYAKATGRQYVDWDSAFKKAIREDWGKIRTNLHGKPKETQPKWIKELSKPPSTS